MQHDVQARKLKLQQLLQRLRADTHVQNRDLKTWLTADEYAAYMHDVEEQRKLRSDTDAKPDAIVRYEEIFRAARLCENRAEGYSNKGKFEQARKFRAKADAAYERLLEHYSEILERDPALYAWFDRVLDFDAENAPSLVAECMPHIVSSRSLNNTGKLMSKRLQISRADVKMRAIEAALYALENAEISEQCNDEKSAALLVNFLKNY